MKTGDNYTKASPALDHPSKKGGRYRVTMQVPNDLLKISNGDTMNGSTIIEITMEGCDELDMTAIRKQLEPCYGERKTDDILEAMQEAADDEIIPMLLRRYIRKGL